MGGGGEGESGEERRGASGEGGVKRGNTRESREMWTEEAVFVETVMQPTFLGRVAGTNRQGLLVLRSRS